MSVLACTKRTNPNHKIKNNVVDDARTVSQSVNQSTVLVLVLVLVVLLVLVLVFILVGYEY